MKDTQIGLASVLVITVGFSFFALMELSPKPEFVDTQEMMRIHDTVVHVDLMSYTFEEEDDAMMILRVVEFWKNPTNASHITVWGNLHEFKEFCAPPNDCRQAIAYLYQDENGIYHKGDYWEWLDYEVPTIVEKMILCYEMFHCDTSDDDTFPACINSKRDGITIKEICADAGITLESGCIFLKLDENMTMAKCR